MLVEVRCLRTCISESILLNQKSASISEKLFLHLNDCTA